MRNPLAGILVAASAFLACSPEPEPEPTRETKVEAKFDATDTAAPAQSHVGPPPTSLDGAAADPLGASPMPLTVLAFVSTHCPISNRYAPTLTKLHEQFAAQGVSFYLVYPDPDDGEAEIRKHIAEFDLPGTPLRDPGHRLVAQGKARVTPQVAIFQAGERGPELAYQGRIDDRALDFGKFRPQAGTEDLRAALDALVAGQPVATPKTTAVGCYIVDLK